MQSSEGRLLFMSLRMTLERVKLVIRYKAISIAIFKFSCRLAITCNQTFTCTIRKLNLCFIMLPIHISLFICCCLLLSLSFDNPSNRWSRTQPHHGECGRTIGMWYAKIKNFNSFFFSMISPGSATL